MVSLDFTSVSPEKQSNTLSIAEQTALAEHERVIERGLKTFYDVGNALIQIRDSRLYRQGFKTFEDYCLSRWQISRPRAFQLMEAASVITNLSTIVDKPINEAQVRPLTQLEPEEQKLAWEVIQQTAPSGKVTAAHVKSVVDVLKEVTRTQAIDDGTGEQIAVSDVFKHAVTEETYERMMRQKAHINNKTAPHVSHNSGVNEWYTPPEYIEAARDVIGTIDLDPASSEIANQSVRATTFYSADDDGLSFDWRGKVWMNPPYASELIGRFAAKFARHVQQGDITAGIVLVNNATETVWFSDLVSVASAIVFTKGRIKFLNVDGEPVGAPLQGQALIYFGDNPSWFIEVFSRFGWGATL